MIEAGSLLSSAAAGDAFVVALLRIENVETLSAGVTVSGALGGNQASTYSPRDFVAFTLLIILFLVIASLGQLAFAVQRRPRRWIPVRVRGRYRADRDPRWR